MEENLDVPEVPHDNSFHSTGDWTEWKCPSDAFELIHARVKCLSPGINQYRIQFRNYNPHRVLVKSTASHIVGSGANDDAQVPGGGGVSVLTRVPLRCGNVSSPEVFITIDDVIRI